MAWRGTADQANEDPRVRLERLVTPVRRALPASQGSVRLRRVWQPPLTLPRDYRTLPGSKGPVSKDTSLHLLSTTPGIERERGGAERERGREREEEERRKRRDGDELLISVGHHQKSKEWGAELR